MNVREHTEEFEYQYLSPKAAKSREAKRKAPMEECCFRTKFQRDRDRILHSKSFRRLKRKTQVYIVAGDHYRTRMTHSLEVSQISRTIARALRLNEDLTDAIALGHDVGHTPFGHAGEAAMAKLIGHFQIEITCAVLRAKIASAFIFNQLKLRLISDQDHKTP